MNTAENKESNICRSCKSIYLICRNQKFVENVFSKIATVRPILLKFEGSFGPTFVYFSMPT